jgi:hypothetical protein
VRHFLAPHGGRPVEHSILNDRAWLKRAYVTDGISSDGIAALVGCDGNAVYEP